MKAGVQRGRVDELKFGWLECFCKVFGLKFVERGD